jgi:hypothetical protein
MGPKGVPDTKTNWSTDCLPQDEPQLLAKLLLSVRVSSPQFMEHSLTQAYQHNNSATSARASINCLQRAFVN